MSIPCETSGRTPTAADVAEALAELDAVAFCVAVGVAEADALGDGEISLDGPTGRAINTTAIRIAATATTPMAIQPLR